MQLAQVASLTGQTIRGRSQTRYGDGRCTHAPDASSSFILSTTVAIEKRPLIEAESASVRDKDHVHRAPHTLELLRTQPQRDPQLLHSHLSQSKPLGLCQGASLLEVAESRPGVPVARVAASAAYPACARESNVQERWRWWICEC